MPRLKSKVVGNL